jgi:hypothetical protein
MPVAVSRGKQHDPYPDHEWIALGTIVYHFRVVIGGEAST